MNGERMRYAATLGVSSQGAKNQTSEIKAQALTRASSHGSQMDMSIAQDDPPPMEPSTKEPVNVVETSNTNALRSKRVRTGCLTCRSRHLKCDEGIPVCANCAKSSRQCQRGLRLNFIDTTTLKKPMYLIPPTRDWHVAFRDESREVADEYEGGLEQYAPFDKNEPDRRLQEVVEYDFLPALSATLSTDQPLPPMGSIVPACQEHQQPNYNHYMDGSCEVQHGQNSSATLSQYPDPPPPLPAASVRSASTARADEPDNRTPFETPRDVLYMQVFVEEVAVWMDSMNVEKHFSELLPYRALHEPMLRYSLLACGSCHMHLINPAQYSDSDAVEYYNKANRLFLRLLQNPQRDMALCATIAVILNVYEVMTEKAIQRMNHIAGSRALIKECGWDASTVGVGQACFFLNVGLELFTCLRFNWQVAWSPEDWGLDMSMSAQSEGGNEEGWMHKMLLILAKVANFRATMPRLQASNMAAEQSRLDQRLQKWVELKGWCDKWRDCVPPTMHPMAYVPPYQAISTKSSFPEIWLIKRPAIIARMFYHSAMALLGETHPDAVVDAEFKQSMDEMRLYHSRQICGIVAHVKDR